GFGHAAFSAMICITIAAPSTRSGFGHAAFSAMIVLLGNANVRLSGFGHAAFSAMIHPAQPLVARGFFLVYRCRESSTEPSKQD
ncbi:MAG: hypothetical protein RI571_15235, partial [Roseovarius sp.]|nr:hypothetical protein [Roseovarius sp.]